MSSRDTAEKLSTQVLCCCRNSLYSRYPSLDGAFAALTPKPSRDISGMGTDGETLWFCPEWVTEVFSRSPDELRRGYLHVLLHCLFLHPFRRKTEPLWNLACDMAVEQILYSQRNILGMPAPEPVREQCLRELGPRPLAAEAILERLRQQSFPWPLARMEQAFRTDDHSLWQRPCRGEVWQHVLQYTLGSRSSGSRKAGSTGGDRQEQPEELRTGTFDYRTYLRRFAVPREEMELDMDSFDYIYYTLGMELYGNLPLIEPLEYREGRKLEELVIAIDTSGSCSREVVSRFLGETYRILSAQENFFRKMRVHLVQCDCVVQSAAVIHSGEEWKNYSREITIAGRGGTDFTPVFRYVEQEQAKGRLGQLRALLYFTDGDGCYPRQAPPYETAFVMLRKNENMQAVPAWARVLLADDR